MADRKPYFGPSGNTHGGRKPYFGHGTTAAATPTQKKKRGGVLGAVSQGLKDLETVGVQAPAGLYTAGKALGTDVVKDITFQGVGKGHKSEFVSKVVQPTIEGIRQDVRHPLRHPGFTALDLLALGSLGAGTAARGAAAAGRLGETGRVTEALGELTRKPRPGPRVLRSQGHEVKIPASRSALTRGVTRQIDKLRERFPDAHIGIYDQPTRVGKALERERRLEYKLHTTPFTQLRAAGRKIRFNSPEGRALRAVAEGTPLDDVIRTAKRNLARATSKVDRKALRREIALAAKAKEHVTTLRLPDGTVRLGLKDDKLQRLYNQTKAAALLEDQRIAAAGLSEPATLAEAIQKPGRIYQGARYTEGQLVGGEGFRAGEFHVGQERRPKAFAINKQPAVGSANTVGIPRAPGRLTHPLTGGAIQKGGLRHDVPSLVAENALESERHAALLRARDYFIAHAQDTPDGLKHPVAIRLDDLKSKPFPDEVKLLQDAYRNGRHMNGNETSVLGLTYDTFRQDVFPEIDPTDVGAHKGVKWIDERLLGGLNKPRPLATLAQHPSARRGLAFADAVNNATKFSILYLKPAYAIPNMLGNTFLTLTQQGFAAPGNIARAVLLHKKLGAADTALVDELMGEGITASLGSRGGPLGGVDTKAAHVWSKVVDLPFRRASFLYEARRLRYDEPARLKRLLHDPAKAGDLKEVTTRANHALIEYSDLTPVEQDIIRRVLFFYPWLKGSVRYAGEYLREHPIQAAFIGQLAQQAKVKQQQDLGDVPPFAEGLFKLGERNGQPLVSNPNSAGILSQPADLAAIASGLVSGHVPRGREVSSLLTPFLGAGNVTFSGYDPFTGRPVEPNLRTFGSQLIEGQPLLTLAQRLRGDQSQKLYPLSQRDALLQFLLGTIAPRPVNKAKLNSMAESANEPRH